MLPFKIFGIGVVIGNFLHQHQLYACFCARKHGEAEAVDLHGDSLLRERLEALEQVSGQGVILFIFGQMQMQIVVKPLNLGAA